MPGVHRETIKCRVCERAIVFCLSPNGWKHEADNREHGDDGHLAQPYSIPMSASG